jgi:DNA-binding CsgD family transcriptional regulator
MAPLTPREADIARLLVEGLSNRQIGSRLFISERTVENHIRNIMDKLGVGTRAQIAGWVASTSPCSSPVAGSLPADLVCREERPEPTGSTPKWSDQKPFRETTDSGKMGNSPPAET